MTKQLTGKTVPDELFERADRIRALGGRVFVCTAEEAPPGACPNCAGAGSLVLQTVYGGPYDTAPSTHVEEKGERVRTMTVIDGEWYKVNNLSYECPVCRGSGGSPARAAAAAQQPLSRAWEEMAAVVARRGGTRTKERQERYGSLR
jgi:hypothetical protein